MSWTVSREFRADLRPPAWMALVGNGEVEMAVLDTILLPDGTQVKIQDATDEQFGDYADRCLRFQDARRK